MNRHIKSSIIKFRTQATNTPTTNSCRLRLVDLQHGVGNTDHRNTFMYLLACVEFPNVDNKLANSIEIILTGLRLYWTADHSLDGHDMLMTR